MQMARLNPSSLADGQVHLEAGEAERWDVENTDSGHDVAVLLTPPLPPRPLSTTESEGVPGDPVQLTALLLV